MYIHIFAFRWKPGVNEEQKDRAIAAIRKLQGAIPELVETHVGRNASPRGGGFGLGGVMKFRSAEEFQSYNSHPVHQELLEWLLPLVEAIEVDFDDEMWVAQQVIPIEAGSADGRLMVEAGVGTVPIVVVQPGV